MWDSERPRDRPRKRKRDISEPAGPAASKPGASGEEAVPPPLPTADEPMSAADVAETQPYSVAMPDQAPARQGFGADPWPAGGAPHQEG